MYSMSSLYKLFVLGAVFFLGVTVVNATEGSFSIYPDSGTVKLNSEFTTDVRINSDGDSVTLARVVLLFDPRYIEVTAAEYNASMFCSYPSDDRTIDNTYGVIVFTGFCQSGVDNLYTTEGDFDVFVRLKYMVKKSGIITLDWKYSGEDEPFNAIILKEGSPPSSILKSSPGSARFVVEGFDDSEGNDKVPNTGEAFGYGFLISGIILIVLGAIYYKYGGNRIDQSRKTIVVYE